MFEKWQHFGLRWNITVHLVGYDRLRNTGNPLIICGSFAAFYLTAQPSCPMCRDLVTAIEAGQLRNSMPAIKTLLMEGCSDPTVAALLSTQDLFRCALFANSVSCLLKEITSQKLGCNYLYLGAATILDTALLRIVMSSQR